MKVKYTLLAVCIIFVLSIHQSQAQRKNKNGKGDVLYPTWMIVEHERHDGNGEIILEPKTKSSSKLKQAQIEVEYVGFTPDAQAVFEAAVAFWEGQLNSDVVIRVQANWSALAPGTLGSANAGTFFRDFDGAPRSGVWYPVALAEKLTRGEMNSSESFDIVANFNSQANWYLGDGTIGANETDLKSVVLHEIAHGLGFTDGSNVDSGGIGTFLIASNDPTAPSSPFIYMANVENGAGQNLVETFTDGTAALGTQLTGDDLYFKAALSEVRLGTRPRIFAPDPYNGGSSIAHLDNIFNGGPHSLMTPSIASGTIINSPGVASEMLGDLGWLHTFVIHDALKDSEDLNTELTVTAVVETDTEVDAATFVLHYSYSTDADPFGDPANDNTVAMAATANPNEYSAVIPVTGSEANISYYLEIKDIAERIFSNPAEAPTNFNRVVLGPDTTEPVIEHTPPAFILNTDETLEITARASDNIALATVEVEYFINGDAQTSFEMSIDAGSNNDDQYIGTFDLSGVTLQPGDEITYRIVATDASANANQAFSPEMDLHTVAIEGVAQALAEYSNDFASSDNDFFGDLFTNETPAGFSDGALHSTHPYANAGDGNELNFISQLRFPIILDPSDAFMRFDEIVLVEPGQAGTSFGDAEFWDFVIVEGSKDDGATWLPLIDGYDSGDQSDWLAAYNGGIPSGGQDSNASGSPSLYKERLINMLANGNFSGGEEILIRFRLFSDPFAFGWGWAIDNLEIQSFEVVSIENELPGVSDFKVYPNPVAGNFFTIEAQLAKPVSTLELKLVDLMGKEVLSMEIQPDGLRIAEQLNVSQIPDGVYVINIQSEQGRLTRKIVKAN